MSKMFAEGGGRNGPGVQEAGEDAEAGRRKRTRRPQCSSRCAHTQRSADQSSGLHVWHARRRLDKRLQRGWSGWLVSSGREAGACCAGGQPQQTGRGRQPAMQAGPNIYPEPWHSNPPSPRASCRPQGSTPPRHQTAPAGAPAEGPPAPLGPGCPGRCPPSHPQRSRRHHGARRTCDGQGRGRPAGWQRGLRVAQQPAHGVALLTAAQPATRNVLCGAHSAVFFRISSGSAPVVLRVTIACELRPPWCTVHHSVVSVSR